MLIILRKLEANLHNQSHKSSANLTLKNVLKHILLSYKSFA